MKERIIINNNSKKTHDYYIEIKNNISVNKKGIVLKFGYAIVITFILTIVVSYWAYSNLFFSIMTYVKLLTLLGASFLLINIVSDKPETALYWKDPEKRALLINIKMKQSFFETIVVFIVNFIILILSPFLGLLNFAYEHELNVRVISYYQPTFLEAVLITIIIILSFIAIWTSMYWLAGFLQIKEYSHKFKRFPLKGPGVAICLMILVVIFWGVLYLGDLLFIEVKVNGNFGSLEFLKDFTEKNHLWVLAVEICILFGLNLLFYFNGDKHLRERNYFFLSDEEKNEIKSKKEKDQKKENKKEFNKTFIFEMLIVSILLFPFYTIFLFLFLSSMFFLFLFISLGFLILNAVLGMLLMTNKISIIKSKN